MEENLRENQEYLTFVNCLFAINQTLNELAQKGDISLLSQLHGHIKEMHAVQRGSAMPLLVAVAEDCTAIYRNFDMILAVLRTVETDELDLGAQNALNRLLHNIDTAVMNIAKMLELIRE